MSNTASRKRYELRDSRGRVLTSAARLSDIVGEIVGCIQCGDDYHVWDTLRKVRVLMEEALKIAR